MTDPAVWARRLRWPHVVIGDAAGPYLLRIYLTPRGDWWRRRLPGLFLHFFYRGDHERDLHNHPWRWALSLILWRGYVESRVIPFAESGEHAIRERHVSPGSLSLLFGNTFHRVKLCDPRGCWTLFFVAPRETAAAEVSIWGFMTDHFDGYREWFDASYPGVRGSQPNRPCQICRTLIPCDGGSSICGRCTAERQ